MGGDGGGEGLDDGGAGHGAVGGAGQQQPGVVVEPVEDLHVGAVGQAPVGEVRLPELVRLVRLEADHRRPRPLAGLGCDQLRLEQDAADGGDRRCRGAFALESGDDRCGARVPAGRGQLSPQRHDPFAHGVGGAVRVRARTSRARLERFQAAGLVAAHELVHPPPGDAEATGGLRLAQALADDGEDDDARLRHASM